MGPNGGISQSRVGTEAHLLAYIRGSICTIVVVLASWLVLYLAWGQVRFSCHMYHTWDVLLILISTAGAVVDPFNWTSSACRDRGVDDGNELR